MRIVLICRGAVHGLRINRKKRNRLSDILYTSLKVGRPVSPLETNLDKERSLFLDYSIQHVNTENAVVSVSRSVILLPSYQPGISSERSSRKLVEHNGLQSYPWSTIQDIHAIANNITRERIRFYEESDTAIDDWRRLLPAESATGQAEQNHQWELDVWVRRECTRQHVFPFHVYRWRVTNVWRLQSTDNMSHILGWCWWNWAIFIFPVEGDAHNLFHGMVSTRLRWSQRPKGWIAHTSWNVGLGF
jgi:hypothetical protein